MYDEKYMHSLNEVDDKLNYLKKCIAEADKEKDAKQMVTLRHDYIYQSVFHGDNFKGIIMFPEFMKVFDENPGVFPPSSFMFPFKWILENTSEFYQVSVEQIDRYYERFKKYIEKFGYTMRTYYLKKYHSYLDIDREMAIESFKKFEDFKRTDMSDCAACEMNAKISYEARFGSVKKAVAMFNSMIDQGKHCAEVPQVTYAALADELTRLGLYDEAEYYADMFLSLTDGDEANFMVEISSVLILKTITDFNAAIEIFSRCAGIFSRLRNPYFKCYFANAAYRLFDRAGKEDIEEIRLRLPSDFELHEPDGVYQVGELRRFFKEITDDITKKFDERNGTDYFSQRINCVYPEAPENKIVLPLHGRVKPEAPAMGILFKSPEDVPNPDYIAEQAEKILELKDSQYQIINDSKIVFYSAVDKNGASVRYRLIFADTPDCSDFASIQALPEDVTEQLEEYGVMLIVMPDIAATNHEDEMTKLMRFADFLNTGGSPAVLMLNCEKMLSSKWLNLSVKANVMPEISQLISFKVYVSAFEEDKLDVVTVGLGIFGSRDFIVPAVEEERVSFVIYFVEKLAEEVIRKTLPDVGSSIGINMEYNESAYISYTWKPVRIPDENGETDEEAYAFAEPVIFLTPSERRSGNGHKISELTKEQADNISVYPPMRLSVRDKMLYPIAESYFENHDCELLIGLYVMCPDEEYYDEEVREVVYVSLTKEPGKGIIFLSSAEDVFEKGSIFEISNGEIFTFKIKVNGETYSPSEMYMIL